MEYNAYGISQNRRNKEVLKLFQEMFEPNVMSGNTRIKDNTHIGMSKKVEENLINFQKILMQKVFSWNAMIAGYV